VIVVHRLHYVVLLHLLEMMLGNSLDDVAILVYLNKLDGVLIAPTLSAFFL
jgi:hypothetical protein